MSQLLCRFGNQNQRLLRRLSTAATPTPTPFPYILCNDTNPRAFKASDTERAVVDINLFDPRKDRMVKIPDQTLLRKVAFSKKLGCSRGWLGVKSSFFKSNLLLTNIYNPSASVSSHKVISLPPLQDKKARISSISLSASPEHQDCVVAAMTTCHYLYLCRPGDSEWIRTKIPFFQTEIMYSDRDRRFYLRSSDNDEIDAHIDLFKTTSSSGFPQVSLYKSFFNSDMLRFTSSTADQYLVESPSGDSFIVCWKKKFSFEGQARTRHPFVTYMPDSNFAVFKQDPEKKIASYTEDIGDLCIFLGRNEAFCLCATDYPGLKPNSIYYMRFYNGPGVYHLSSKTLHDSPESDPLYGPCMWLAPIH